MKWYQMDVNDVERKLHVFTEKGLSYKQVEQRQKQFGLNTLQTAKKQPIWVLFMKQFQDFMVIILLAATLIAGMLGEYIDAIAIMTIVLLNGFIGFFQEQKAEKSLEKLKELSAPKIRVLRDGEWSTIPSEQAVVGDVIRIITGDRVPADFRIVKSNGLETEESTLTGESLPVEKTSTAIKRDNLTMQDQSNIGFKSTLVTKGSGIGIVVQTGMNTAIGQIASLMVKTEKVITPLELKLIELGKVLIYVVFLLTALTVGVGIYHGQPLYDMVLAGVSLAVAVIPEGLPAIVTVALSLGVQRMIKRKAIVRKLSAVETLGCASVICSDKTGTITENKMTVKEMFLNNQNIFVTGEGYATTGEFYANDQKINNTFPNLESMLLYGLLCNEASLLVKKGKYMIDGDPTDGALLIAARKMGLSHVVKDQFKMIKQFPFDSTRKRMSVIVEDENNRRFLISKGAPEMIVPRCTFMMHEDGRQLLKSTKHIEAKMNHMAEKALRIIAISIKPLQKGDRLDISSLEKDLTFIGLFGLMDPPRKEVKKSIEQCKAAGIKTVMITGDHKKTATAIAKEIGLQTSENDLVLEGYELNNMDVNELVKMIDRVAVFARVTPEHKLKIVQAFQKRGHIVAMTGDGVNDAPAIKASNIGVSMGMSGTDVTKEASSLILMDDNFNTIKEAIREGRNIYENIRKFIRYLLASNVGEIFIMLVAMMLALPLPLVPVQILWVNLVTDGLPAMALGLDPPETNVMKQKPRDPKEGVFSRGLGFKIISRGLMIGIVSLIAFMITYDNNPENLTYARSVAFTTLVVAQLIHVFDCRSEQGIFSRNPFSNFYLIGAVLSSLLLLLVVLYVESLQPIFHTMSLGLRDWLFIIVLSALPTVIFGFSSKR
ncbi:cation-translocating P-type ATPase [Pseudogracilibacillus auburnensis]|uniref:Ca2+-transporting ATPase n=1 Tax=Pseudogracilibacillus auburnensis TaxID=1494959 RepID=A0A2V3W3L8_9BACI|nr:cation-translocating P-type ATPase [Pseudogracilibacillus auburnensis]PXW88550.1 Ca2+-transporting ATPase [Pseudogracilibacillus auburnensis]